jgi:hypothetical protein
LYCSWDANLCLSLFPVLHSYICAEIYYNLWKQNFICSKKKFNSLAVFHNSDGLCWKQIMCFLWHLVSYILWFFFELAVFLLFTQNSVTLYVPMLLLCRCWNVLIWGLRYEAIVQRHFVVLICIWASKCRNFYYKCYWWFLTFVIFSPKWKKNRILIYKKVSADHSKILIRLIRIFQIVINYFPISFERILLTEVLFNCFWRHKLSNKILIIEAGFEIFPCPNEI